MDHAADYKVGSHPYQEVLRHSCASPGARYIVPQLNQTTMSDNSSPTDRSPGEYLLFAGAFVGFLMAAGGIVVASVFLAVSGLFLLLFTVSCLGLAAKD
jgi:hypothetical protein